MEPVFSYFAAGIASILLVLWNKRRLKLLTYRALRYIQDTWKYLSYKHIFTQHQYLGPWTASGILLHVIYFSANGVGILYPPLSGAALTERSGVAALINISFLACSPNADLLSEIFDVTPKTWRQVHRAVAWMVGLLITLHLICALRHKSFVQLARTSRIGSILGSTMMLTILSASVIKWLAQERPQSSLALIGALISKFHLPFAIAATSATYMHVIVEVGISWQIFIVPGCFLVILLRDFWCFLYRNGMLSGNRGTQVSMIGYGDETIQTDVYPGRPVHIYPGQYILLWVPSMTSWWHFELEQHHVLSWAFTEQQQLKLFHSPKSRPKILANLASFDGTASRAFFAGPYGLHCNFLQYETILIVVYDYGLFSLYAQIQYIYQCIEERTSRTRRIHLVWQWDPLRRTPQDRYPQHIIDHFDKIDKALKIFSENVGLDRAVIKHYLRMYNPPETNKDELERLVGQRIVEQEKDSDALKLQKHDLRQKIDRLEKEIAESDQIVNETVLGFYDDVKIWMNAKLKRNIDNFSEEFTVYDAAEKVDSESGRAKIKAGLIPFRSLFDDELANHRRCFCRRSPETQGKFLLMISGPPSVQELAYKLVTENLRDVDLKEFQYKPGHRF